MVDYPQKLLERITVDPRVMVGKPTIRGLRITVEQILKALAGGVPREDILEDYPELEPEDIQAVLLYAAERIGEERVFMVDTGLNMNKKKLSFLVDVGVDRKEL